MHQRRKIEVPTGPALRVDQVCELWVWIWSAIDQNAADELPLDEAHRLAVAFDRAANSEDHRQQSAGTSRDWGPRATALLAHYLMTRHEHLGASKPQRRRLVIAAAEFLDSLLGIDATAWQGHFERLGVSLDKRSVFRPEVRSGVTIESLEEGPVLPGACQARSKEAADRLWAEWQAARERPRRRRMLEEVTP